MAIAKAAGKSYVVRAVTTVHGESDDYAYATDTQEFRSTGTTARSSRSRATRMLCRVAAGLRGCDPGEDRQTLPIPLLLSQHSGWNDIATSAVDPPVTRPHVRSKGKVVLVTAATPSRGTTTAGQLEPW